MVVMTANAVSDLLARYRIMGVAEAVVQDQIERALRQEGVAYEREVELAPGDRIDFMVGPVGVEVKTKGTRAQIIRQLARYVRNDRVEGIVLAATSRRVLASVPDEITGMTVTKHLLQGRLL
jgi:hypothetical protein